MARQSTPQSLSLIAEQKAGSELISARHKAWRVRTGRGAAQLARLAAWRAAHPAEVRKSQGMLVERNRVLIENQKKRPCTDCGIQYDPFVMEFDHVRGEKAAGLAWMATHTVALTKVIEELQKCDVVCANCHRLRTKKRGFSR